MYSYEEVYQKSLEYFYGNEFATKVFVDKYALRKDKNVFLELTPDEMHRRLAKEFARIEAKYSNPLTEEEIYNYLKDFSQIIPQGSPMSAIGNPYQVQSLSNCFVIPAVGDSIGSIHLYDQRLSQIFKRRGGCGGDITNLRPRGSLTNNSSLSTTGIGTWMEQFSETSRRIGQEGRRAAQMITLAVHHPEVNTFIDIKHDETKVTGANISIRFSDDFMSAVKNETTYKQKWQGTKNLGTDVYDIEQEVDAKEVWNKFIHSNWLRGDPGSLFWDTIIRNSPADMYAEQGFRSESTNPCQPSFATVLTPEGIKTFAEIGIGSTIWSGEGWTTVTKKWSTGIKPVYQYITDMGAIFVGTENHKIVSNNEKIKVKEAKSIDVFIKYADTNNTNTMQSTIISTSCLGTFEVFDITVNNLSHTYWTGGCNVSNCSEIILSGMDACRLILINLLYFVKNKFTSEAYFDFDEFAKVVRVGQRLMDDLVDLEIESIDKIIAKIKEDSESNFEKLVELDLWEKIRLSCVNGRRTGLGITAIGDTFACLNMKYCSDESIYLTDKIYKTLAVYSYTESINMAKERGSFPIWNYEQEINNEYLQRLYPELPEEVQNDWKTYGRRNIANLTTAPAGSLSNLALFTTICGIKYSNTTSGIEPSFLLEMDRYKKINQSDTHSRVDKVDVTGEKWQKFTICHSGLQAWKDVTGQIDITESPYFNSTANELDPYKKIDLISSAIKWVDHSISNTTNLPETVTEEEISKIYMYAYEKGLKGLTIYRDNCRQHQVLNKKDNYKDKTEDNSSFNEYHAPKRPQELPCDIHHCNIKGASWLVMVGLMEGKPYEIWGGLTNEYVEIPKIYKDGKISKSSRGKYNLHYNDTIVEDLISTFDNPTYGFNTRAISTMLRHGVPLQYIVDQIQKDDKDNTLYSFNKVISRVLKKYIKEGTKHSGQVCGGCKSEDSMKYQEGCLACVSCGWSKC